MEYRKLAFTDLEVSRVGFGGWAIGGHGWGPVDDHDSAAAIHRALDRGINLFDTADVYGFGHSEEVLASALGDERRHAVIATKFGMTWDARGRVSRDVSPARVVEALEASLRRLRLDCIPLYQVHWPDGATPVAATMEALRRCQEAGKIRWIGCCNFSTVLLREAWESGPVVSLQVPYNILDRDIESTLLPDCRERGVGVLAYSSLAQGLFSGRYGPDATFEPDDVRSRSAYFRGPRVGDNLRIVRQVQTIGAAHGRTGVQVAIRWILDNPGVTCALTGIKTAEQVEENAVTDWKLPPADRDLIDAMSRPDGR